jgi:heme/copper-type cytochrome/quinol oxidase subunit 3
MDSAQSKAGARSPGASIKDTRMQSLKQLIARATRLTVSQPILWTPPLGIALLSSLMAPQATPQMGIILLVTALITLAVTAGWYALIAGANGDQPPVLDDFFVAIGRHFVPLVVGTIVFGLLIALVAVPLLMARGAQQAEGYPARPP